MPQIFFSHQSGRSASILLTAALVCSSLTTQARPQPVPVAHRPVPITAGAPMDKAAASIAALPLSFEQNLGQTDASTRFVARGETVTVVLGDGKALFTVPGEKTSGLVMSFGSNAATTVEGESKLPGIANYFIGNDPAKWRSGVPTFGRVRYTNVQPGIDLVFHGTRQEPEFDFVVAPGADPANASFTLDGARIIRALDNGDLAVDLGENQITMRRPVLYQETAEGRASVAGAFRVDGDRVSFAVGGYDRSLPLVIDPVLAASTLIGGNGDDRIKGLDLDSSGNFVVAGFTNSTNFPVLGQQQVDQSGQDAFVTKMNSTCTALIFSTYLGGNDTDNFQDIDVNPSDGRIALGGSTASSNAPFTNGYDSNPNSLDAWIVVLSSTGASILYSSVIGGGEPEIGNAIAWDASGNAYLAGDTVVTQLLERNFPTKSPSSLDPFQKNFGGGQTDAFVTKWDPDQTGSGSLVYSTLLGGSDFEIIDDIVVDSNERAYVCGHTESSNFPRQSAIQNTFGGGVSDGFITKFNADGTAVFFSTFYGGNGSDQVLGIALDVAGGNLPVVCGLTTSTNLQTVAAVQAGPSELDSGFAAKLIATGGNFVYSTYFGGSLNDNFLAVTADAAGNAYFTGTNNGGTFPDLNPIEINGQTPTSGAPIVKLSAAGQLLFSTRTSSGTAEGIAVDASGNIYIAGTSSNLNYPSTPGAFQSLNQGINDGFMLKVDPVDDDTVGVWTPNTQTFKLRNSNTAGPADLTFNFGASSDRPVAGDWDGDGVDTIGVYTPSLGRFSVRNSNSAGAADLTAVFGGPNLQPIAGDWDGDGDDSIGVFDTTTGAFFLKNTVAGGNADLVFFFGPAGAGAKAIAGDWDGDGIDTIGVFIPSSGTFFLRNSNDNGNADISAVFGSSNSTPVTGDWDGDGIDTIGTFQTSLAGLSKTWSLRNSNTSGAADLTFNLGSTNLSLPDDLPVVGNWDGQ